MAVRRKSALWTEFVTIISLVHIWDRRIGYRKVDQHRRVNVRTCRNRHTNPETSFEEDPDPAEVIKVVVSMPGYHMTWNLQLILAPPHFPMNTFCNLRNAVVFVRGNIHHPFSYMDPSGLTFIPYWRKTTILISPPPPLCDLKCEPGDWPTNEVKDDGEVPERKLLALHNFSLRMRIIKDFIN